MTMPSTTTTTVLTCSVTSNCGTARWPGTPAGGGWGWRYCNTAGCRPGCACWQELPDPPAPADRRRPAPAADGDQLVSTLATMALACVSGR